jgi:hypothetical protein
MTPDSWLVHSFYCSAKIAEVLRREDANRRLRLHNEFNVYPTLEQAYKSGQLPNRIAPHCYGAFEGYGIDILILDLCQGLVGSADASTAVSRNNLMELL